MADDEGAEFPGAPVAGLINPADSRSLQSFRPGLNATAAGAIVPEVEEDDTGTSINKYRLKVVGDDILTGAILTGGVEGANVAIAKQRALIRTTWDVGTRGNFTYTFIDTNTRKVVDDLNDITRRQRVDPPYEVDVDILFASDVANGIEITGALAQDLNVGAHRWINQPENYRARVKAVNDDTLICDFLNDDDTVFQADVIVAKPREMQRTFLDTKTISGLKYEYTNGKERTVTIREGQPTEELEIQQIVPFYEVTAADQDKTIIYVKEVLTTGITKVVLGEDVDIRWMEADSHRDWVRKVPQ